MGDVGSEEIRYYLSLIGVDHHSKIRAIFFFLEDRDH